MMNKKTYRLGITGLVHDHVWNELPKWQSTGRVEFTAVADPNRPLVERAKQEFGLSRSFDDALSMFENCELDVVQICTSNSAAVEVVELAARHGVHVVLEKPMAATLEQADRMLEVVQDAGIRLLINWPNRWRTPTLQAWQSIKSGAIGHVFHASVRMAHKGPREFGCSDYFCDWLYDADQNGGGAIIDYCCYGAVAFRHLFGMPRAVQGVAARLVKSDIAVDDNASINLIYDDRFAMTEASWSQIPSYHDAVYLGTTGAVITDEGRLLLARESGREEIAIEPLASGYRTGPETFLTCLERDEPFPDVCDAEVCRDAQAILQAGLESAQTGKRIALPHQPAKG